RALARAGRARAAAPVGGAAPAHPRPGRVPRAPGPGAGGARQRRGRAPAPAAGLVPGGRGLGHPRAAGLRRAPEGLRPGALMARPAAPLCVPRRLGAVLALCVAAAPLAAQVERAGDYLAKID